MNEMHIRIKARLENESVVRTSAVAFLLPLNLTMETMMEVKTILAEALVNAIIHGYESNEDEFVDVIISYDEEQIDIVVSDDGVGIGDINLAMQPLYTSKKQLERSGMGLSIMDSFCDYLRIESEIGKGCRVIMSKKIQHV